ncbi:MAG TPA: hypothetical protein H9727_06735 [Candidatus Borkfalkia avistercoris]|uniref:GLUG domain-containing protein n=1 Tax=Candidatus Borkfalkia avistercoris TaxID=2838504 RepID=A0A9D2IF29_9FIRM|nr:hypothetical protein [Candidatus Borkfalkia avistercoris]
MKKLFKWIALCLALMLAFGIAACSKEGEVAQSESAAFIAAVEEIGEVSLESRVKIDDAYAIYDELTQTEKQAEGVTEAKATLDGKKAQYDALVAADAASGFLAACEKVPAAENVTKDDQAVIEMAENLYNALSEAAKQANGVAEAYAKLTAARGALDAMLSNVIKISSASEFAAIGNDLTANYELTSDIDMSSVEWTVLGAFSGTLNGNGYTLKNFQYTPQASGFAIFTSIAQGGVVENLGVTGYVEDAGAWAGVICVDNYGTIRNCWTNVVLKTTQIAGYAGMIALNNMGKGAIENCYTVGANLAYGTEFSLDRGAMLLESAASASVSGCFVLSDNNEMPYAIGKSKDASLYRTEEEMKQASLYAAWDTDVWNIENGSFPTLKRETEGVKTPEIYIVNAQTELKSSALEEGRFKVKVAVIDADFADVRYSLKAPVTGVDVASDGTVTVTAQQDVTFTVVASVSSAAAEAGFTVSFPKEVISISTPQQLLKIADDLSGSYELTADIDLTGIAWQALGGEEGFSGTFNGNGYTIKNFEFTPGNVGFALFKKINAGAVVENVCLEGTIENAGSWFGTVTVDNSGTIRNCMTNVSLGGANNDSYGGGICCNNKPGGVIENCVVLGAITSTPSKYPNVHNGAFAVNNEGTIRNCLADKETSGLQYAAGQQPDTLLDMLKTTAEMKSEATYGSAFDAEIWNIEDGKYPALRKTA